MKLTTTTCAALVLMVLLAAGGGIAGHTMQPAIPEAALPVEQRRAVPMEPLTFSVVGDSITAVCLPTLTEEAPTCSWAGWLDATRQLHFVGGWAQPSATTSLMAQSVVPRHADVLVVLAGTNNFAAGLSFEQTRSDLDAIVATVGADDVVLIALPPISYLRPLGQVDQLNQMLESMTVERGWGWVDPWGPFLTGERDWVSGAALDGVHPTPEVQAAISDAIASAVLARPRN